VNGGGGWPGERCNTQGKLKGKWERNSIGRIRYQKRQISALPNPGGDGGGGINP
jgi:hypothetical protein